MHGVVASSVVRGEVGLTVSMVWTAPSQACIGGSSFSLWRLGLGAGIAGVMLHVLASWVLCALLIAFPA